MNQILKKVKDIRSAVCVTIILKTHRTKPDNRIDAINLKNMIKEAEARLQKNYEKKLVAAILENINRASETIDHNFNLESLVIFANEEFVDFTRLPIDVIDRVVIDNTFATRDLVRAMHHESAYYVLVLSRQKARLIEAYNDKVVSDNSEASLITNSLYTADKLKLSTKKGQDNLIEEFFNRVDKAVLEIVGKNPLPIILVTEKRNYDHFYKTADKKELIVGHINKNRDDEKAHHIIPEAWRVMQKIIKDKNSNRIQELKQAVSARKYLSDYTQIWNAIMEGRGKTLFVKRGFFQAAKLQNDKVLLIKDSEADMKGAIDDIIDEMIEHNIALGGDIVFIENDDLDGFQNIALTTRY